MKDDLLERANKASLALQDLIIDDNEIKAKVKSPFSRNYNYYQMDNPCGCQFYGERILLIGCRYGIVTWNKQNPYNQVSEPHG